MVCVRFVTVYACALCLNKKFQVNVLKALSDCQLSVTSATGLGAGTCTVIPDQPAEPGNLEIHQYLQRIKNIPRQVY